MFGEAWKTLETMHRHRKKPNWVTHIINGYAREGMMNEALKTMMKMKIAGIGPHLSTYNSFINGYAKKGKMDEVRNIMKTMELINGYAKNGMMDEARKTLETMQQKRDQARRGDI